MSEQKTKGVGGISELTKIVLTGIVSLIVGVGSSLLIEYVRWSKAQLVYEITTSDVFSGQTASFALITLKIQNTGNKEVESLTARLISSSADVKEAKVTGLAPTAFEAKQDLRTFALTAPFLNPRESLDIQILVAPEAGTVPSPKIEIRGKGIVGSVKDVPGKRPYTSALVVASATLLTALGSFLGWSGTAPARHGGDRRDVLPFLLETNGLTEDALELRQSAREVPYWSAVDRLTSKYIGAKDGTALVKLVLSLKELLDYAPIAETSIALIKLNVARIYTELNYPDDAQRFLDEALSRKDALVSKRLKMFPKLLKLVEDRKAKQHT